MIIESAENNKKKSAAFIIVIVRLRIGVIELKYSFNDKRVQKLYRFKSLLNTFSINTLSFFVVVGRVTYNLINDWA